MMTMHVTAPFRSAGFQDANALARLIDRAGEGLPSYLWAQDAEPGQTPLCVGQMRAMRETGGFSYRNAYVCETPDAIVAMLLGYRLADPYEMPPVHEVPGVVRPLIELEALAAGSWYINALAVFPDWEGRGYGRACLRLAQDLAREARADTLSLIVAEQNVRAMTLYQRMDFREKARRPIIPFPGLADGGDWVLMVKPTVEEWR